MLDLENGKEIKKSQIFTRTLTPIKSDDRIRLRTHTIVGYMESGKTTMAKSILPIIRPRIEEMKYENILPIYSLSFLDIIHYLKENIDEVKGTDYIYMIIDDAALFQLSREFGKSHNIMASKLFFWIRHIFEKEPYNFRGSIIVNWLTQRYMALDVNLREGFIVSFKTPPSNPNDRREMYMLLGRKYMEFLGWLDYQMYTRHNDEVKKYSVTRFRSGPKGKPVRQVLIVNKNLSENFIELEPEEDVVELITSEESGKRKVIIAYLLALGWTYREIQENLNVSSKTIAKVVKWIKEEVGRLG